MPNTLSMERTDELLAHPTILALIQSARDLDAAGVRGAIESDRALCAELLGQDWFFLSSGGMDHKDRLKQLLATASGLGWIPSALLAPERRQALRETLDALAEGGADPRRWMARRWRDIASQAKTDMDTLEWVESKGVFAQTGPEWQTASQRAIGLAETLAAGGERGAAMFGRLRACGLIGGGPAAAFGASELAGWGFWAMAGALAESGDGPAALRPGCAADVAFGPIEGLVWHRITNEAWRQGAQGAGKPRGVPAPSAEERERFAQETLAGVRQLAAWGSGLCFDAPAKTGASRATPLRALCGNGQTHVASRVSRELLEAVGPELVRMGADPNDGPALALHLTDILLSEKWGAHEARQAGRAESDPGAAQVQSQWAFALGLDMSKHVGHVLAKAASKACSVVPVFESGALDELERWGARASLLQATGPSPVEVCLRNKKFAEAKLFLERGAPLAYVSRGECALHAIVQAANAPALKALSDALSRPEVLRLLDHASTAEGREGETPLHQACAVLNLKAIEALLAAGANPDAQDAKGWTPIRHALRMRGKKAQESARQAIVMLTGAGANPALADQKGQTAAQSAAGSAPLAALGELIGQNPADVAEGKQAVLTRKKLARRGGEGLAIAEEGELRAIVRGAAKAEPEPGASSSPPTAGAGAGGAAAKRKPRSL
jgi:hypothetical protein